MKKLSSKKTFHLYLSLSFFLSSEENFVTITQLENINIYKTKKKGRINMCLNWRASVHFFFFKQSYFHFCRNVYFRLSTYNTARIYNFDTFYLEEHYFQLKNNIQNESRLATNEKISQHVYSLSSVLHLYSQVSTKRAENILPQYSRKEIEKKKKKLLSLPQVQIRKVKIHKKKPRKTISQASQYTIIDSKRFRSFKVSCGGGPVPLA